MTDMDRGFLLLLFNCTNQGAIKEAYINKGRGGLSFSDAKIEVGDKRRPILLPCSTVDKGRGELSSSVVSIEGREY
jgi:hypothetical protein